MELFKDALEHIRPCYDSVVAGSGTVRLIRSIETGATSRLQLWRRGTRIGGMATALKSVSFEGAHFAVVLEQLSESLIVMRLSGTDTGELLDAPIRQLDEWLVGLKAVEFFIDARDVRGASIDVSSGWAAWLTANRAQFKTITMLTGTKFIQITAEFVRRFAGLNGIMWVCTDPKVFDLALEQAQRR